MSFYLERTVILRPQLFRLSARILRQESVQQEDLPIQTAADTVTAAVITDGIRIPMIIAEAEAGTAEAVHPESIMIQVHPAEAAEEQILRRIPLPERQQLRLRPAAVQETVGVPVQAAVLSRAEVPALPAAAAQTPGKPAAEPAVRIPAGDLLRPERIPEQIIQGRKDSNEIPSCLPVHYSGLFSAKSV